MIYSSHGQRIELHYRRETRPVTLHLAQGVAVLMGHGRGPHNVLVLLDDGRRVVVPCGNVANVITDQRIDGGIVPISHCVLPASCDNLSLPVDVSTIGRD